MNMNVSGIGGNSAIAQEMAALRQALLSRFQQNNNSTTTSTSSTSSDSATT
jgi:hypothetical protein